MSGSLSVRLYTSISQAVNQALIRLSRISLSVSLSVDVCQPACFFARMREFYVCLFVPPAVYFPVTAAAPFVCLSFCMFVSRLVIIAVALSVYRFGY